jgi:hypothetical protein
MADSLYLNLWFSGFSEAEMMPRLLCVLEQFPFSATRPGVGHISVHGISWSEPEIFEQSSDYTVTPGQAAALAAEFLHDDNGYIFEAAWDLWSPSEAGEAWIRRPHPVRFLVHGARFEEGAWQESGHIQLDLGLDSEFLLEGADLDALAEMRIKENIETLVNFTNAIERQCGVRARLLWSESEENLAQKLIARLQRVN